MARRKDTAKHRDDKSCCIICRDESIAMSQAKRLPMSSLGPAIARSLHYIGHFGSVSNVNSTLY